MQFGELHEYEAKELLQGGPTMLLPVGAVEVHGDHLPLSTDTMLAEGVARLVAQKLPNAAILPPVHYGQVWSLRDFAGCIDISNDTLANYIADIGKSLARHGAKKLAIINGHVGNAVAIKQAARILYECCDIKTYFFTYPGADKIIAETCTSERPHKVYFHACEIETSYMLYLASEHVDMEKAIANYPAFPADFDTSNVPWSKVLSTAVMGDATAATAETGKVIIDAVVDNIVTIIQNS